MLALPAIVYEGGLLVSLLPDLQQGFFNLLRRLNVRKHVSQVVEFLLVVGHAAYDYFMSFLYSVGMCDLGIAMAAG